MGFGKKYTFKKLSLARPTLRKSTIFVDMETSHMFYNALGLMRRSVSEVVKLIAFGAGGLGINSRTGQIGHSVAYGSSCHRCIVSL